MEVGGLQQDKKFLEKAMEATKARNEEVEQKLQVSQDINLHTDRKPQNEKNKFCDVFLLGTT